jgi:sulfide dehydrogenase cytochrome subunit
MGYKKKLLVTVLGAFAVAGSMQVQAEPSAAMMANTCAGCHGTNGASVGPASPNLAGMSEVYFTDTMMAFKSGDRQSTIMGRIAKGYTDAQIKSMAGFFASKPVFMASQKIDAGMAKKGAKIYDKGCAKCHDENGALPDDDAGILAGQWLPYLEYSMQDFASGHRDAPKKMAKAVKKLSDDEIAAVLAFFASQK